jgi:hypothetical protein
MQLNSKGIDMTQSIQEFGLTYFSSPEFYVSKKINAWMPICKKIGATVIVLQANFSRAIPEDVFLCAKDNQLKPIVYFTSDLPLARKFNDVAFLLDVYAKWGVNEIILGNKPNMKRAWPSSGWHDENLVDHFLDRFIPFATHTVRLGMNPVAPPLQPGGDYWDTAFMESFLLGLKRRQLSEILAHLLISSYAYTFEKPLSWGRGGPERWSNPGPYQSAEGQQDQLGFNHYEWMQAIGRKVTGQVFQTIILDAGSPCHLFSQEDPGVIFESIREIIQFCKNKELNNQEDENSLRTNDSPTRVITYSLDTLNEIMPDPFEPEHLFGLFEQNVEVKSGFMSNIKSHPIKHYLLLPLHQSGVSDAILNKVRPIVKAFQPTIGFSLNEASMAEKVSIYPDPSIFSEDDINQLRTSGCIVDILPESGIDIATSLQTN